MISLAKAAFFLTPFLIGNVVTHGLGPGSLAPAEETAIYEMTTESIKAVEPGTWGGTGISFVVAKDSVDVEFDCANAKISEPLKTNKAGKFTAYGSLEHEGGPTRMDATPAKQKVRFEGAVHGKQMSLKVSFVETAEVIGSFTLGFNRQPRLRKCR